MAEKSERRGTTALFLIRGILIFVLNLVLYSIVLFVAVNACRGTYSFANEVFGDVIAEAPPAMIRVLWWQSRMTFLPCPKIWNRKDLWQMPILSIYA